jgi:hypothetical protein
MTIEEAQQRIAAAKAELGGGGGSSAGAASSTTPPADAPQATPAPPPPSSAPRKSSPESPSGADSAPAKAGRNVDDHCGSPCRALASMRRAVTALCRMTSNDDARCVDAKKTLAESEARVSPCSC